MNKEQLIGCWIDGAVPRTKEGRESLLRGLLAELNVNHSLLNEMLVSGGHDSDWDWESELLEAIDSELPEGLAIFREAGDVVICERSELE